jgi:hypothetical protein
MTQSLVLPIEDLAAYQSHLKSLAHEYDPQSASETHDPTAPFSPPQIQANHLAHLAPKAAASSQ